MRASRKRFVQTSVAADLGEAQARPPNPTLWNRAPRHAGEATHVED